MGRLQQNNKKMNICCICMEENCKIEFNCSTCNGGKICCGCFKDYNKIICPYCRQVNLTHSWKKYFTKKVVDHLNIIVMITCGLDDIKNDEWAVKLYVLNNKNSIYGTKYTLADIPEVSQT
jgi:hypothetical protein